MLSPLGDVLTRASVLEAATQPAELVDSLRPAPSGVILDIVSRFVVGWLIAPRECSELAQQIIADTVSRHDVEPGMLTLHADRGAAMLDQPTT